MRRIAVLQVHQESNHFNPVRTGLADYALYGIAEGARVLSDYGEVGEIGGFREGLARWTPSAEAVGIVRYQAWPSGPLARGALEGILAALRRNLEGAGRLDGVLCCLHGSMVAEGDDDVDGTVLEAVRAVAGPSVPVVATLDLHAYVTPRMTALADCFVPYHTSPHMDQRETGLRAAAVLDRILKGARPACASVRLPMISIAEAQNTFQGPLAAVYGKVREIDSSPGILSAAVLMTQGWLDVPRLGWSTLVTADGDSDRAARLAEELAVDCWSVRESLREEFHSAAECVELALAHPGKPVIVADGADATNSGAAGDSTHLLAALTARSIPGLALAIMVDPGAVAAAAEAGVGGRFRAAVGGKRDTVFSKPLPVEGRVEALGPARYVLSGHGGHNLPVDMGRSATVRVGDVRLLLVEAPGPGGTPLMYRCVGLEPRDHKIVVVKSPAGFRAEYGPFASRILLADCPGCASPRYAGMPYSKIHRPLWPLDPIRDRREAPWAGREEPEA